MRERLAISDVHQRTGHRMMLTDSSRARACGVALSALLAILAGGCMVGPDFKPPQAPVAAHWIDAPVEAMPQAPDTRNWWLVFGDPTLNTLIQVAYHGNLSLQATAAHILQAQAQLRVDTGELFPQQQVLSGAAQRERQSQATLLSPALNPFLNTSQFGLSASWELDFWGKYRRVIQADRATMLASVAAYDNALVSLDAGVASTYINIRTYEQRIRVAETNVNAQTESLRIAKVQFEAGETDQLDVQQATTQLSQTQAQIPGLKNSIRTAKDSLAVLLGITPDAIDKLLAADAGIPAAPSVVADGVPRDLLRRRPDVMQAELAAAAQSAAIGVAKANLYPAFSLNGSFGFAATSLRHGNINNLFNWDNHELATGASFVFPVFNYGRIVNSVRVQDAEFEQAVLTYQNTVLQAQQEVEDARSGFRNAQLALASLTDAAGSAKRATQLAIDRYKEGATDYTTVLTAEQAELQIEDALQTAKGNVPLEVVAIYKALGGGWQLRQGRQLLPEKVRHEMEQRTNWKQMPDQTTRLPDVADANKGEQGEPQAH